MTQSVPHPDPEAGVTLTEILVALVIVGMMSTAVILSITSRPSQLETESERLYARLLEAEKVAITTGKFVGVTIASDGSGYGFLQYRGDAWVPWDNHPALQDHTLPVSISLQIETTNQQAAASNVPVIWMDPAGYRQTFEFRLSDTDTHIRVGRDQEGQLFLETDDMVMTR